MKLRKPIFEGQIRRLAEHAKFYQRVHLDFRRRMCASRSLVNKSRVMMKIAV